MDGVWDILFYIVHEELLKKFLRLEWHLGYRSALSLCVLEISFGCEGHRLGFKSSQYGDSFLNDSRHVHLVTLDDVLELRLLLNAETCGFTSWLSLILVNIDCFVTLDERLIGFNELLEDAFSWFFAHFFSFDLYF